jgi:hypothetical protein
MGRLVNLEAMFSVSYSRIEGRPFKRVEVLQYPYRAEPLILVDCPDPSTLETVLHLQEIVNNVTGRRWWNSAGCNGCIDRC